MKTPLLIISGIVLFIHLSAVDQYPEQLFFESDPVPQSLQPMDDPLQYAGERLGIDVRNFVLPRAYEGGYRFNCRFPVIDMVADNPLYLKQWAEDNSAGIGEHHRRHALDVVPFALAILDGADIRLQEIITSEAIREAAQDFRESLKTAPFTEEFRLKLEDVYMLWLNLSLLQKQITGSLTAEELQLLKDNPAHYLVPDGSLMPELTGDNSAQQLFIETARKVNYQLIFSSAAYLAKALQDFSCSAAAWEATRFLTENNPEFYFAYESPFGLFVASGYGNDIHRQDAGFLLDLGGDDVYYNNAGGCGNMKYPAAVCLDLAGNDRYEHPEGLFVQGFGFLGTGILMDLQGNDTYQARHFAQGAGICGVGILWDADGDDIYDAHSFCQGAGMFGLGLLLEDRGNDQYDCASLGQGAATTLGLGLLSDLAGQDHYRLAMTPGKDALGRMPGYGQGGALSFRNYPWNRKFTAYGGIGFLCELGGDDLYETQGWCDQGGSYIMSLGALVDAWGDDKYYCHCGQGSGIHITNAILIDRNGDDYYQGEFRAGGSGGDRSPGIFLDYNGHDSYVSRTSSYGTGVKPYSFSLFIDYLGNDLYICKEPEDKITFNNWDSFGGVWPESEPHLWPYAICLDLAGGDMYLVRNRANNSERHSFGHGIHLDTEWQGRDLLGKITNPMPDYSSIDTSWFDPDLPGHEIMQRLADPSTFNRFRVVGEIAGKPQLMNSLLAILSKSDHRQLNRDILECLHYYLIRGTGDPDDIELLSGLINFPDEEVRIILADNCGLWEISGYTNQLLQLAEFDSSPTVRRYALSSLSRLPSEAGFALALQLALQDPDSGVQRVALQYITRQISDFMTYWEIKGHLFPVAASAVKVAYLRGISTLQQNGLLDSTAQEAVTDFLRNEINTYDVYVRRAAAVALCDLYQLEGISWLIESLSFPSIDAFENYNNNIPNVIARYTGYDLPDSLRYSQEAWENWFQEKAGGIDLELNVTMYRNWMSLQDSLQDSGLYAMIYAYEDFLEEFPSSQPARLELASLLNREAWDMITRASASADHATALHYAQRAVELHPVPMYIDTLAEAYFVLGRFAESRTICQEQLLINPQEKMFLDRIERIDKAMSGDRLERENE